MSCNDVLHKVVVVDLDLQDDVVEVGQVQIDEQDVQVEDKDIDEGLEDTWMSWPYLMQMK